MSKKSSKKSSEKSFDIILIGGGLAGLTLANAILQKLPSAKVALIEKNKIRRPELESRPESELDSKLEKNSKLDLKSESNLDLKFNLTPDLDPELDSSQNLKFNSKFNSNSELNSNQNSNQSSNSDSKQKSINYLQNRYIALSLNSKMILDSLGLWDNLTEKSTVIKNIEVSDQGGFGKTYLSAQKEQLPALGYNLNIQDLGSELINKLINNNNQNKNQNLDLDLDQNQDQDSKNKLSIFDEHTLCDIKTNLNSETSSEINSDLNPNSNSKTSPDLESDISTNQNLDSNLNPNSSNNINSKQNPDSNLNSDLNPNLSSKTSSDLESDIKTDLKNNLKTKSSLTLTNLTNNQTFEICGKLIIATDGANSSVRDLLKIPATTKSYNQSGVVSTIQLKRPRSGDNLAFERFTKDGPLALLPCGPAHMSMVWATTPEEAEFLKNCPKNIFLQKLQENFGYKCGKFIDCGTRSNFALNQTIMQNPAYENILFLGNAAHTLHPVAGQGFNLSITEIIKLTNIISDFCEDLRLSKTLDKDLDKDLNKASNNASSKTLDKNLDKNSDQALNNNLDKALDYPEVIISEFLTQTQKHKTRIISITDDLIALFSNNTPILKQIRRFTLNRIDNIKVVKTRLNQVMMGLNNE